MPEPSGYMCVDMHEHMPTYMWAHICSQAHTLLSTRVRTWHMCAVRHLSQGFVPRASMGPRSAQGREGQSCLSLVLTWDWAGGWGWGWAGAGRGPGAAGE